MTEAVINDSVVVVKLKHPIQSEGETLTELRCCQQTARELRGLPGGSMTNLGQLYPVLAACCGVPECDFDRLDVDDLGALQENSLVFFRGLIGAPARNPRDGLSFSTIGDLENNRRLIGFLVRRGPKIVRKSK